MPTISTGSGLIDSEVVLEAAKVHQGMTVADLGCGALGHFVFPAANRVGRTGRVYAVDIMRSVLKAITSRVILEGIQNIEVVWGNIERAKGTPLSDGSLDVVLVVNNLSLAKNGLLVLTEALRMLKTGGTLVLVDWKPTAAPFGPPVAQRVTEADARLVAQSAGFRSTGTLSPGQYHYGLLFVK